MKKATLFILPFFLLSYCMIAQIVRTDIPFPQSTDSLTITFDATQGTAGLAGFTGDVYAHTGVITEQSTSPTDWRYVKTNWGENTQQTRLRRIGLNTYTLTIDPNIRSYYGVPQNEEIEALAFVFRSAQPVGGSYLEGKAEGGADIFIDLYDNESGFFYAIQNPVAAQNVYEEDDIVPLLIYTSQPSIIEVDLNDSTLFSLDSTTSLIDSFSIGGPGNKDVVVSFTPLSGNTIKDTIRLVVPTAPKVRALASEFALGVTEIGSDSLRFVLEAPGKSTVWLLGSFSNWSLDVETYTMHRTPDGRYFWLDVGGIDTASWYTYQYVIDGELYLADPLSETILDPFNDPFIGNLWPELPDYPKKANGLVSLGRMGGYHFDFQNEKVTHEVEDLVIYELLLRDFIATHDYERLKDTLTYFKNLGINAIQLMPINEFEGNISWGYNPSFHGAIDKYYGRPDQLKAFIDAAHAHGISVFIDVVYNHTFSQSPHCQMYWDNVQFRPGPDNPWLNVEAKHPFNVGYDYNHEYEGTQRYVKQTLARLLQEYMVDGFRFDLSKGFTQRQSNDVGQWNAYDGARIARLQDYADHIWQVAPDATVILEHLGIDEEERELSDYGMLLWNKMTEPFNEATMGFHAGGRSDFSRTYFPRRGFEQPHLVSYMESHDEERLQFKNQEFGNSNGSYNVKEMSTGLSRIEAATAFFYAIPGPKMLWQFGELGYDFSINWCENGSIDPACRTGPKPIRWDYLDNSDRIDLWHVTADMIYLKTQFDIFRADQAVALDLSPAVKRMRIGEDAIVLGNFDIRKQSVQLNFPQTGVWYEYFSGDSINLNSPSFDEMFEAGEYRLYLRTKITRPSQEVTSIPFVKKQDYTVTVYPNPIADVVHVLWDGPLAQQQKRIWLLDDKGAVVGNWEVANALSKYELRIGYLPAGVYTLLVEGESHFGAQQIVKH